MTEPQTLPKSISEILGARNSQLFIPKYQRGYVWKNDKIEDLFSDILDDPGHFLGTLLFINRRMDDDDPSNYEIVDGQQRLVTISLFLMVLYARLNKILTETTEDELKIDIEYKKREIKKYLILEDTDNIKLTLSDQQKNSLDFISILKFNGVISSRPLEPRYTTRRLYKAYLYLFKKIESKNYSEVKKIMNDLTSAYVVRITVKNSSSAYKIFECLNDRGQRLAAIDLIKNKMFSKIEEKIERGCDGNISANEKKNRILTGINEAFLKWNLLLENINDTAWQDRFLRHYYLAFNYNDDIKIENKIFIRVSETTDIFEKLADKNVDFVFNDLISKSNTYKNFVQPDEIEDREIKKLLIHLKKISAKPAYILLLYLFEEFPNNISLHREVLMFLRKYFIRRHLTGIPDTNILDRIFVEVIKKCQDERDNVNADFIQNLILGSNIAKFADLNNLKETLEDDIYDNNPEVTRVLLMMLAEPVTRTDRDLWDSYFEIEHIFPQGKLTDPWIQMVAEGNKENAEKIKTEFVHKIGNLTLTAYNKELSNKDFSYKRDRKENDEYIGYKNEFKLNSDLKNATTWNKRHIQTRTKRLVKESIDLLKFENIE